jgi:hypothetical protein
MMASSREGTSTSTSIVPAMKQPDEALRLLAQAYARQARMVPMGSPEESALLPIRDMFYAANSQQEAYEYLSVLAEAISDHEHVAWSILNQARTCVEELIRAGGSAESMIVGLTDGYCSLCLECSREEDQVQQVRFFRLSERRPLLKLEVEQERAFALSICQQCFQPIHPRRFVLFTPGGTCKHAKHCNCGQCNRAGISYLLNIYECEQITKQVILPALQQIGAPSKPQSVQRAIEQCREQGWYMLNQGKVLP